jgi:hypothetical protein
MTLASLSLVHSMLHSPRTPMLSGLFNSSRNESTAPYGVLLHVTKDWDIGDKNAFEVIACDKMWASTHVSHLHQIQIQRRKQDHKDIFFEICHNPFSLRSDSDAIPLLNNLIWGYATATFIHEAIQVWCPWLVTEFLMDRMGRTATRISIRSD